MVYLLSPKHRIVKMFLFVFMLSAISGVFFHNYAQTSLQKRLYRQENWQEVYGKRPVWCHPTHPGTSAAPDENSPLSIVCGYTVSGRPDFNEDGVLQDNIPLSGVTVEIWEDSPFSPTGELDGKLVRLFSSTSTDANGRFAITMRKVGPPNLRSYLIFKCGGIKQKPYVLDTWHDYWDLNFQLDCARSDTREYVTPLIPYSYIDGGDAYLGCDYSPSESIPTGLQKMEEPVVNNYVRQQNYDHRYGVNEFALTIPLPIIGSLAVPVQTPGGYWEPDCLLKSQSGHGGSVYACGVTTDACAWATTAGGVNQLGDGTLCDTGPEMSDIDRTTRPAFNYIPKTSTAEPFRRLDIKANIRDYMEEPLLPMATTAKIWGTSVLSPFRSHHVFLRGFREDPNEDDYMDCEEYAKRNVVGYGSPNSMDRTPWYNGGPAGHLAPPDRTFYSIYREIMECDPTITDSSSALFCKMRRPTDGICNSYKLDRTKDTGNPIRLCEIQPPDGPTKNCRVGDEGCGSICGNLGYVPYVLDKSYFSTDWLFATGLTYRTFHSNVTNDSIERTLPKSTLTKYFGGDDFDGESKFQDNTQSRFSRADKDLAGGNSQEGPISLVNISDYVDTVENITNPFGGPFTNTREDYEQEVVWKIGTLGNPQAYCGLGEPYKNNLNFFGPFVHFTESAADLFTDNMFRGGSTYKHLTHRTVGTSTYYMSQDAIDRDRYFTGVETDSNTWTPIGLVNGGVIDDLMTPGGALNSSQQSALKARDVWDSLLSMLGGDARLHREPETTNRFSVNVADVVIAAQEITNESQTKTFGQRSTTLPEVPLNKNYYDVSYPLSEENFMEFFPLPGIEATGDSDPFMPNDWGAGTACYPVNQIPATEGQNSCETFREPIRYGANTPEDPSDDIPVTTCDYNRDGSNICSVSRTCRVDDCEAFWQVETATCRCTSPDDVDCDVVDSSRTYLLNHEACTSTDRYMCAHEEETTLRYPDGQSVQWDPDATYDPRLMSEEVPMEIACNGNPVDDASDPGRCDSDSTTYPLYDDYFDPQPGLDDCTGDDIDWPSANEDECIDEATGTQLCWMPASVNGQPCDSNITGCTWIGDTQSASLTSGAGPRKQKCDMSTYGPMMGGDECNGELFIGDFALRLEQRPPVASTAPSLFNYRTQKDGDDVYGTMLKISTALASPVKPPIGGKVYGLVNADNTDSGTELEGHYTTHQKTETIGFAPVAEMAMFSRSPLSDAPVYSNDLPDLYYHCFFGGTFDPSGDSVRGEMNVSVYTHPDVNSLYADPDEGAVDDNNDGDFTNDPGWTCRLAEPPADTGWVSFGDTGGACSIPSDKIASCLSVDRVPDDLSMSFINIINTAANAAGTPAGAIIAIMAKEGGFAVMENDYTDTFGLNMASRPWYGRIQSGGASMCNELVWSAQGPFQILQHWWNTMLDEPAFTEALEDIQPGRSHTVSRCNLLDSALWVAFVLKAPGGLYSGPGICNAAEYRTYLRGLATAYGGGSDTEESLNYVEAVYDACY